VLIPETDIGIAPARFLLLSEAGQINGWHRSHGRASLCPDAIRMMLAKQEIVFSAATFAVADRNSACP